MNCKNCNHMKVKLPIKNGNFKYRQAKAKCVNELGLLNHKDHFPNKIFKIGLYNKEKNFTEWVVYGELCRLHSEKK